MDIGKCQNMPKWPRSEESSRGWSFEWSWHELTRCSRRWGTNFLARAPRTWAQISSNLLSSYGLLQCIKFEEFIDISTCVSKKIYLELSWHNLDSSRPHLYSLDSCVRICPNAVCLVCQGTKQACLAWSFVHLSTWERFGVDYRQVVLTHDAWDMLCFVPHVTPVHLQLHADYILLSII